MKVSSNKKRPRAPGLCPGASDAWMRGLTLGLYLDPHLGVEVVLLQKGLDLAQILHEVFGHVLAVLEDRGVYLHSAVLCYPYADFPVHGYYSGSHPFRSIC